MIVSLLKEIEALMLFIIIVIFFVPGFVFLMAIILLESYCDKSFFYKLAVKFADKISDFLR